MDNKSFAESIRDGSELIHVLENLKKTEDLRVKLQKAYEKQKREL